jgi:hypothetical protein
LRHGLTAQTAVLANENREHFDEMLEAFQAEYHPAGPTENLLVHQMVTAAWRLARMRGIETGLFNLGLSDLQDELETNYTGIEENDRQAFVFRNDAAAPRSIENLFRYESRIERSFYRALHELQRIRAGGPSVHDPVGGDGQSAKTDSANQSQSQDRTPLPIQAHDRFDVKSLPARAKQGQTTASTVRISSEVEAGRRLGRRSQSLFRSSKI